MIKNAAAVLLVLLMGFQSAKGAAPDARGDMVLWYRQAAGAWIEAMPVGNGILGATVFGQPQHERIALNECTFWSGRPHDYDNPQALEYFPRIRDLVFAHQFQEAEKMADDHFFGEPKAQQAYQPLGDLLFNFDDAGPVTDYRRELDLENGIAKISYRAGDVGIMREVFVSYPDRVLVVHMSADKPGGLSLHATLTSPYRDRLLGTPKELIMDGQWKGPIPGNNTLIARLSGKGIRFRASLMAAAEGGAAKINTDNIQIAGANAVTFVLGAATSFVNYHDITADPPQRCQAIMAAAADKGFAQLRSRHIDDFRGLMGRVHLRIGDEAMNQKPTDERLKLLHDGHPDPNLEALCFQFGRYVLASSSRAGGQPANLQGIWNEQVSPPWGSKYTININTEMNYWPAEVTNLSECHQPLFDMLKDISETGARTARVQYGHGGWVAHHNIDLWRGTAPVDAARFGMWPVGGAWLCQDIWEHYAFTGDEAFLKEYYPVMKGAAQFLLELMVEDPKSHWLVTPFSMSPEHGYFDANGKMAYLSPSPTMDIGIIRELFPHCIEASKTLGIDEDFRTRLQAALKHIPPYQINHLGQLQEWIEDWRPGNQGHNCSANFPFYPGSSITLRGQPQFAEAIQRWMEGRRPGGGFPSVWYISIWSRLERGDKAGQFITGFVANAVGPNMHHRGSNQSDATLGFTAGVAESLIQSHAGEISLLPALAPSWKEGSVTGLCARGGFTVDIEWKNGRLSSAQILSRANRSVKVRYGGKTATINCRANQPIHITAQ